MMRKLDPHLLRALFFLLALHLLNNYLDRFAPASAKRVVILHFVFAVVGVTLLQYAMARTALRLLPGSLDPALRDRLSLNPLRQIDFPGFLLILLCGVGSARAIEADWRRSAQPRRAMRLVHLTGLFTAIACAMLFSVFLFLAAQAGMPEKLLTLFSLSTLVFLKLFALQLLPLPPLAGAYVLLSFLPRSLIAWVFRWERHGAWLLVVLAVFSLPQPWIHRLTELIFVNLPPVMSLVNLERLNGVLR